MHRVPDLGTLGLPPGAVPTGQDPHPFAGSVTLGLQVHVNFVNGTHIVAVLAELFGGFGGLYMTYRSNE